jgi:hypothetical protein
MALVVCSVGAGEGKLDGKFDGTAPKPTDWWSLRPLRRPEMPKLSPEDELRVRTPVDAFILAKLREQKLARSPEADRRTLIRRVYFDLVGLPPAPDEVAKFVKDSDPEAYKKLVDRLLALPEYGERWARHWLDVVHYGETHGYDKDQPRSNAWPYRDYVIRAFNEDKPFTRFIQEQLAGDALYPGTVDGTVALGFIAAGPWDFIGHVEVPETKIDGMVARHLDRDDMVGTAMNTFASFTVQCAQCHSHKFDPVNQEDYYGMQAVFAGVDRVDRPYDEAPEISAKRTELMARKNELTAQKAAVEKTIAEAGGDELKELEKQIRRRREKGPGSRPQFGYHSQIEGSASVAKWVQIDLGKTVKMERLVFTGAYDDFNSIGAGFGFPVRFKIEVSDDAEFSADVTRVVDHTEADYTNPLTNPQTLQLTGRSARYVRMTATKLAPRKDDYIFALAELSVFDERGTNVALNAAVTALDSIEAPPRWQKKNLVDGFAPEGDDKEKGPALAELEAQRKELVERVTSAEVRENLAAAEKELAEVNSELNALPKPKMVYAAAVHYGSGNFVGTGPKGGKPRPVRVLHRGDVRKPGEPVRPGALSALESLKSWFDLPEEHSEAERRVALANWISDPRNPLTWRSIVNRIWLYHFGRGIVDSPNDFGKMGQLPTHPELLDWLAVEFRDGRQSFKELHRLILNSATYRQSSLGSAEQAKIDAENRFLWRMNRRRLEAEAIRDSVLQVAGKLDPAMFGPSFQDFVVEKPEHSPHYQYHLHDPEDPRSHRRSIYRFIVRSQQQPFMTTLDCADPSMQVDKRNQTLTALQALAMLNNKLIVSMAKHFAARLDQDGGDLAEKIDRAFSRALARAPTEKERTALTAHAREHGLPNTCRLILNLNEFIFVD